MAKDTAKIRFLVDRITERYTFKKGEVYELSLSLCHRWVRRNVACYVDIGDLETATVPHEPKQPTPPAPKHYKGCDGEGSFASPTPKVPDIIPLDEADTKTAKPKAVKRAQSAKNK